jgi:hypothetical protein
MVVMVEPARYFGSDNFWDSEIDYHVYAKREQAIGRKNINNAFGLPDTAASMREFEIRMKKARALDKARKNLIQGIRDKARTTFPDLLNFGQMSGAHVKRTVGGVEGIPDSAIML